MAGKHRHTDGGQALGLFGFVLALIGFELALIGFVLGSYWVRFSRLTKCPFVHNPLLIPYLRSFDFFGNWLCFA